MVIDGPMEYKKDTKEYRPFARYIIEGGFRRDEVSTIAPFRRNLFNFEWGDTVLENAWTEHKIENEINLRGVEEAVIEKMRKDFRDYFNKKYREENRVLQIGDIVTRSLKKGDIGLFNRGHLYTVKSAGYGVVPLPQKSLAFNLLSVFHSTPTMTEMQ